MVEDLINKLKNSDLKLIEKDTGIPYDRMYKWTKGKSLPKISDYNTLTDYFRRKTSNTGKSSTDEHFNEHLPEYRKPNPRHEARPLHLASDPNDYDNDGSKFEDVGGGIIRMRVPIVPVKAYAGYLRGFQDPEFYEDLTTISIDVFKEHRGHYLTFEVEGDSMMTLDPDLFEFMALPGWKAVSREVPRHQWAYKLHTHKVDTWIIVHNTEGILIKQIVNHDVNLGTITVHSLNPKYPDETFNLNDVAQIFNVVKFIIDK